MNKMKNSRSVIPNLFTTLNILCGFLALISTGDEKIIVACWLITLAGILDMFDGQVARLMKSVSNFGTEFDSLADVISFGVAPSVLLHKAFFYNMGLIGIMISFIPLMCGGIRLARFNVVFGGKEKKNFVGLPIPLAAISIVSFIIFNFHFWDELHLSRFLIPLVLLVSLLMVSKVKYYVFPKVSFKSNKKNSVIFLLIVTGTLIILTLFPQESFFPFAMVYVLWGVVRYSFKFIKNSETGKPVDLI